MKASILTIVAIVISLFVINAHGDNENTAVTLGKRTYAKPLNTVAPVYPRKALRRGIEGWVIVGYIVTPDGTTDEIEVLGSSIDGYFDDAAIEAARNRTYTPATASGKPVMQGNVSAKYTFTITDTTGGVSRSFMRLYKDASKAIEDSDLDLAWELIDQLERSEKRLLAEVCYLDMLKAAYYENKGDSKAALKHLERALVIADEEAAESVYINLLKQAIIQNARANNLRTSLERYDTLVEVDKQLTADDQIHGYAGKIEQILNSDRPILKDGEVTKSCRTCLNPEGVFWHNKLNRSRFLIDQVQGSLDEVEILCERTSVSVAYQPETAWTVNREGGECLIRVYGDRGTTFRLVELPFAGQQQDS